MCLVINQVYTFTSNPEVSLWYLPSQTATGAADGKHSRRGSLRNALAPAYASRWRLATVVVICLYFTVDLLCACSLYNEVLELTFSAQPDVDLTLPWIVYLILAMWMKAYLIAGKSRSTWLRACSFVRPLEPFPPCLQLLLCLISFTPGFSCGKRSSLAVIAAGQVHRRREGTLSTPRPLLARAERRLLTH